MQFVHPFQRDGRCINRSIKHALLAFVIGSPLIFHAEGAEVSWKSLQLHPDSKVGFRRLDSSLTGISFVNQLSEKRAEHNRILENGSGVAAGDVNGDGWVDLYFCSLEGENVLYLNRGKFHFEKSQSAGVACPNQVSTGAIFADIDGDEDLDLFVSGIGVGTRCFLNDGSGNFLEKLDSGLKREAGSMSMAFADADADGDLDLYVANYQTMTWKDLPPGIQPKIIRIDGKALATPADRFMATLRKNGKTTITELGQPDEFYLNDGRGHFESVDWLGGRFLDEDGKPLKTLPRHWGLSVAFRDFNGDASPDIYVCNDFLFGNDDFFLNQGDGNFQRIENWKIRHSSWSSMAIDVADVNRDGNFDFMVVEMLSRDLTRRLTQRANAETGIELREVGMIFDRPQQQHNTLFVNRGDGSFAEIAHFAGVEASEWSWCLAFLDVDLDGFEDILIGNGHAHDLLDGDATIDAMRAMRAAPRGQTPRTLSMYPRLDLPDMAFRNRGDLRFEDVSEDWGFDAIGITSAMCLADFDNDGDLDVATNRLQSEAGLFENIGTSPRIKIKLKGRNGNTNGAGARVRLIPEGKGLPMQQQEITIGGRYLSGDESALVFATAHENQLQIRWRSGTETHVKNVKPNRVYTIVEPIEKPIVEIEKSLDKDHHDDFQNRDWFVDRSEFLNAQHKTNLFDDLQRQPLLPRLLSQLDPGIQWADVNRDGFEDLILPPSRIANGILFMNVKGKHFEKREIKTLGRSHSGGVWMNVKGKKFAYVSGVSNYESGRKSESAVAIFHFEQSDLILKKELMGQKATAGPIVAFDYDGDGDLDLFVGGRVNPGRYPFPAISRIYENQNGTFKLDLESSRSFVDVGLVSGAVASDWDGDGDADLALALEWGAIQVWLNEKGRFENATKQLGLNSYQGWWNGIAAGDFDEDGRMDWVATNWGRNSKYERYRDHPLRVIFGDVDGNDSVEIFEMVYDESRERWGSIRDLIVMGEAIPRLQNRTHSYREYAEKGLAWALDSHLQTLPFLEANWLESSVFLNRESGFEVHPLPMEAQWAPAFGVVVRDFDGDGHEDIFLSQNFFSTQSQTPRYDAGLGLLLTGKGDGSFEAMPVKTGIRIFGEGRGAAAADFDRDGRLDLAVAQNGAAIRLFQNQKAKPAHRVILIGPPDNRQAIGARLRQIQNGKATGPLRELHAGSGFWSQSSLTTFWKNQSDKMQIRVTWHNGRKSDLDLTGQAREWVLRYSQSSNQETNR